MISCDFHLSREFFLSSSGSSNCHQTLNFSHNDSPVDLILSPKLSSHPPKPPSTQLTNPLLTKHSQHSPKPSHPPSSPTPPTDCSSRPRSPEMTDRSATPASQNDQPVPRTPFDFQMPIPDTHRKRPLNFPFHEFHVSCLKRALLSQKASWRDREDTWHTKTPHQTLFQTLNSFPSDADEHGHTYTN